MYSKKDIWGVLLVFGLTGCAHYSETALPESRSVGDNRSVLRPPDGAEATAQPIEREEPTGTITLRDAFALALIHNPELRAFALEARAHEAATLQAQLYPNPTIGLDLQDIGALDSIARTQLNFTISQPVELGGKRSKRTSVASATRDRTGWDYETKRIDVMAQVALSFIDILSAQQQLGLAEEAVLLAEQVATVVSERVKGGKVSPIEENRTQLSLSSARIDMERAKRGFNVARYRLAAMWGSTTPLFEKGMGDLDSVSAIPSLSELTQRLSKNPEMARAVAEIARHRAGVDLAISTAIPDVTLTGGYRRYSRPDDNAFIIGFSIPLPLFNKNQGGIQEARYRLTGAEEEQRAAEVRVITALTTAHLALATAHVEVTTLKTDILPKAESAFEAMNEGYRLGKFSLLELLDAQRTLFGARARWVGALTDYHRAVVGIERLIGELK